MASPVAVAMASKVLVRNISELAVSSLVINWALFKGLAAALLGGVTAYSLARFVPGSAVLTALLGMTVGGLICLPLIWSEIKLLLKL